MEDGGDFRQKTGCITETKPSHDDIICSYMAGAYLQALASARRLLAIDGDQAETWNLAGACEAALGQNFEAAESFHRAIALDPSCAHAWNNLGQILSRDGREEEAVDAYHKALHADPTCVEALSNLGLIAENREDNADAEDFYRRSLAIRPEFQQGLYNLGRLLLKKHSYCEAEQCLRALLALAPAYAQAQACLGQALAGQGRDAEALEAWFRECEHDPKELVALTEIGLYYQKRRMLDEAYDYFGRAARYHPNNHNCLTNYANILHEPTFARNIEAQHYYRAAALIDPDHGQSLSKWLLLARTNGDWSEIETIEQSILALTEKSDVPPMTPFDLLVHPGLTGAHHHRFAAQFAGTLFASSLAMSPICRPRQPLANRSGALRIGYLASTFNNHAVMQLIAGMLDEHDPGRVNFIAYSIGSHIGEPERRRVESAQACIGFRHVAPLSDQEIAHSISHDRIDILIDLNGYTQESRPTIQALRPAPINVNWLGYPGTLGHPRLADYLIGDPIVTPLSHQADYSEMLALMPDCYQPNDDKRQIAPCPNRNSFGLPENKLIFACFNAGYKISPATFKQWMRLLHELPDSVLWLLSPGQDAHKRLVEQFMAAGINPQRLILAPPVAPSQHFARLQLADLTLDTFPYTSHTTGSDALFAGVPFVTRMGSTFTSRVAASLLTASGLPELITHDDEACFALTLRLARDHDERQRLRNHLISNRTRSALFDTRRFTRNFESLLERMQAQIEAGDFAPITLDDVRSPPRELEQSRHPMGLWTNN